MICLKCGRPLTKFAASYPGRDGVMVGFGPVCARSVIVKPTRLLSRAPVLEYRRRAVVVDEAQLALDLVAA